MATKAQVKAFIELIAPYAMLEYNKGKKILPSVCIAQGCCESAYGTQTKMKKANAVFGIKVGKSGNKFGNAWKGKVYDTKTKECYDGSTYVTISDKFRAYDSIQDSVTDYYDMLISCSCYRAAVGAKDYKSTIEAIKAGGYSTDPKYVNTICSIIRINNLERFDSMVGITVPVNKPTLRKGSKGTSVRELQTRLVKFGYLNSSKEVDGSFGPKTLEAVKAFQADRGLSVDGVVGPKTWAVLTSA